MCELEEWRGELTILPRFLGVQYTESPPCQNRQRPDLELRFLRQSFLSANFPESIPEVNNIDNLMARVQLLYNFCMKERTYLVNLS